MTKRNFTSFVVSVIAAGAALSGCVADVARTDDAALQSGCDAETCTSSQALVKHFRVGIPTASGIEFRDVTFDTTQRATTEQVLATALTDAVRAEARANLNTTGKNWFVAYGDPTKLDVLSIVPFRLAIKPAISKTEFGHEPLALVKLAPADGGAVEMLVSGIPASFLRPRALYADGSDKAPGATYSRSLVAGGTQYLGAGDPARGSLAGDDVDAARERAALLGNHTGIPQGVQAFFGDLTTHAPETFKVSEVSPIELFK